MTILWPQLSKSKVAYDAGAEYIREQLNPDGLYSNNDSSPTDFELDVKGEASIVDGDYTTGLSTGWLEYKSYAMDYGFEDAINPPEIKVWTEHASSISTGYFSADHRNMDVYRSNNGRDWTLVYTYAAPPFLDTLLGFTSIRLYSLSGSARFWKVRNRGISNIANQAGHTFRFNEITPIGLAVPFTPEDELWGHWTMDDVSGGFVNEHQNQFDGKLINTLTQDASDKRVGTHSMNFYPDDHIRVLHSRLFVLSENGRSITFWMKPTTVAPSQYGIIQKGGTDDDGNFKEWQIWINNGELFAEMVDYTGATVRREKLDTTITAGEWVHIAVSFTGITSEDEIKIWKNKVQGNTLDDKDPAKTIDPDNYKKHDMHMGGFRRSGVLRYFIGKLDDVRFYGKAINQADINKLPGF